MIKDYNQTFQGLEKDIISKVHKLQQRKIFVRQTGYGLLSLGSFMGLISAILYVKNVISTSGVSEYLSLLLSDSTILLYWKELSLTIVESLPFLGLAALCGAGALFLWSALRTKELQTFKKALI